jgi:hypothetical protein
VDGIYNQANKSVLWRFGPASVMAVTAEDRSVERRAQSMQVPVDEMSRSAQAIGGRIREVLVRVGGGVFAMVNELDWVRWQLDRLACTRLMGRLAPELEATYERLVI